MYIYLNVINYLFFIFLIINNEVWGLGIGDWGLGPIPNPQSPIPFYINFIINYKKYNK